MLITHLNSPALFVAPQADELLSSWLIRSSVNTLKFGSDFFDPFNNLKSVWYQDIDRASPSLYGKELQKLSPFNFQEIYNLSLCSFNSYLYEKDNPKGVNKWIHPLSFLGRKPTNYHLYYCAFCMSNQEKPYFKKQWRIKLFNVCLVCGMFLRKSCPHCDSPIHFFRNSVGSSKKRHFQITDCFSCGKNITRTFSLAASDKLIDSLIRMSNILKTGIDESFQYSFIYFDCIYQVYKTLTNKFYQSDSTSIIQDAKLFHIAEYLLRDFPEDIVFFSKNRKISKTVWLKDFNSDRFYFIEQLTSNLSKLRLTQFD